MRKVAIMQKKKKKKKRHVLVQVSKGKESTKEALTPSQPQRHIKL